MTPEREQVEAWKQNPWSKLPAWGKWAVGVFGVFLLIGVIGAIAEGESEDDQPEPAAAESRPAPAKEPAERPKPAPPPKPAPEPEPAKPPGEVTRAEYGEDWPLTVARGILSCHSTGGGAVVFTAPDGTVYWVNGHGSTVPGAKDIEPIWRDSPEPYIPKVSIGPLIDRGLELCE
jgi:hypothetical protein